MFLIVLLESFLMYYGYCNIWILYNSLDSNMFCAVSMCHRTKVKVLSTSVQ